MQNARRLGRPPVSDGPSTRERLLDAALELFARKGYAATSIREIATVVGLRDSAIYGHFASKQAMYQALFDEAGTVSLDALELDGYAVAARPPAATVPHLVGSLIAAWSTPRARLFASVLLREGAPGEGWPGVAGAVEQARDRLEPLLRRWQADGLLRPEFPAGQLVWELFTPLAALRFLHLHAESTDHDLHIAVQLSRRHAEYFIACTATSPEEEK